MLNKISECDPEAGFILSPGKESLIFWKYIYFIHGISTRDFKKELMSDIHDVIDVHNALHAKSKRQSKINSMIAKISGMK